MCHLLPSFASVTLKLFSLKGQSKVDIWQWITPVTISTMFLTHDLLEYILSYKIAMLPFLHLTPQTRKIWQGPLLKCLETCEEKFIPIIIVKLRECDVENDIYVPFTIGRCSNSKLLAEVFELVIKNRTFLFQHYILPKLNSPEDIKHFFSPVNFNVLANSQLDVLHQVPFARYLFDQYWSELATFQGYSP